MIIRALGLLMTVAFTWFAWLQLNDPDPLWWVVTYGTCAVISVGVVMRRVPRNLVLLFAMALTGWALWLLPQTTGLWWQGEIEREVAGLGIALLWCLVAARWGVSRKYR